MALALARSAGVRKEAERAWQEIQELRQSMQAAQRADRR
jgi:hypothetical protein